MAGYQAVGPVSAAWREGVSRVMSVYVSFKEIAGRLRGRPTVGRTASNGYIGMHAGERR